MIVGWESNADNIEFADLVERLSSFGITQRGVATVLGVSPGQVSRVKRGERHASPGHLPKLRKEIQRLTKLRSSNSEIALPTAGHSVFEVNRTILGNLSPSESVAAFRSLLWARAASRGIPITRVSISSDVYSADGGVDASILECEEVHGRDELLTPGTRFQIKTGAFAPWQKSQVKRELFGRGREPKFENLGSEIQDALRDDRRFVVVCFGVDPIDRDLRKACKHFKEFFTECGYPNAVVEVWGQAQLMGLLRAYPSLCLQLSGHDHQGFRSHQSWCSDDDMQPPEHYSAEQQDLIDDIRETLRLGEIAHVRLIGEPGVGKTRLALELTKAADLAPVTLYVKDGRTLLQSSFVNELVQVDDHRFVFLVVDECSQKDIADIWNILKSKSQRIRIISIDHGPDESRDNKTRVVQIQPTGTNEIQAILRDHKVSKSDARRWADYCEGCPRVAHVIGANLEATPNDLLAAPTTSEVWRRFIDGRDATESEEAQLRRVVLYYCSLFERFGFEVPVDDEANFIQLLASRCDPRITPPRFKAIIAELRRRRIVQGVTTLYITPRLLHVHLYREFWRNYGSSFDIAATLEEMPRQMWDWFVQMLRYSHECLPAEKAIDKLLGPNGIFQSGQFPDTQHNGRMISALAETCPKKTLHCLRRTIGEMEVSELRKIRDSRQWLVWALEKLAVWEDCFVLAAELLLDLAESENANNSNNATGTFVELFSLVPGWGPTQASPRRRLESLVSALESESAERRRIGLLACANALNTSPSHRMLGPEYQGLRPTIPFWIPKTYGELWDAYRDVWQLFLDRLRTWEGEDRRNLISTIIDASWSMLHIEKLADSVVGTLETVAEDEQADIKTLVEFIQRQLRHEENLTDEIRKSLKAICERLNGHDFASKLRRFVKHVTSGDFRDESDGIGIVDRKIGDLVESVRADPQLLLPELSWLICEDSSPAYSFAYRIGQNDQERYWLPRIREAYAMHRDSSATSFLSGYLRAVFVEDVEEWEEVMLLLAEDPVTADRFSDFVVNSGVTNAIARRVIEQCRRGLQSRERLERWWFDKQLRQLDEKVVIELIRLQLEGDIGTLWSNAVQMSDAFYTEGDVGRALPEQLVFELLTSDAMADGRVTRLAGYHWSRVAEAFVDQFPDRKWDLFLQVLRVDRRGWSVCEDLDTNKEGVLTNLLRNDPEAAWECVAQVYYEARNDGEFLCQQWLASGGHRILGDNGPGPIQFVPADVLFSWIEGDVEDRAYWLTRLLPKTLDQTVAGRLTRDFVAKYGKSESVRRNLYVHFQSRSWSGNASDYFRKLRDRAREWLVDEKNRYVIRWIEEYIEGLSGDIERAEIDEERRF